MRLVLLLTNCLIILIGSMHVGSWYGRDPAQELADKVAPNVVKVLAPQQPSAGGTGWLFQGKTGKYIVTNAHICRIGWNNKLIVELPGERRSMQDIVERNDDADLCIVKAPEFATGLKLARSASMFQSVWAFGHPHLQPLTPSAGQLLKKMVIEMLADKKPEQCTGKREKVKDIFVWIGFVKACIKEFDAQYTSIVGYPGNSGSPVVNAKGDVVGVIFAGDSVMNKLFIVPLEVVQDFLAIY